MKNYLFLFSLLSITLISCSGPRSTADKGESKQEEKLTFLALGDSYTIGEAISSAYSWPMMLTEHLSASGYHFASPTIIAQTGWRSDDLIDSLNTVYIEPEYDLVSLQIGVNNQYQGKSIEAFSQDLKLLLKMATSYCKNGKKGVFMLSIPDYGVTPFGMRMDKKSISSEIDEFNSVCKEIAQENEIPFYDITRISRSAKSNYKLLANDKLHPSPAMYKLWVEKITPLIITDILKELETQP